MPKLLIVDDDPRLRAMLQRYLENQGFEVRAADDTAHMDRLLQREHFDLLLLDILMPDEDGMAACKRLRASGFAAPVIMLTARGELPDKVLGLELGADDYLAKPFEPRELVARIRAVLRRSDNHSTPAAPAPGELRFGRFRLAMHERRLYDDQRPIELTSGEFALLNILANHPFEALSRERLQAQIHGTDRQVSERGVDVLVSRLRRVLEDDPRHPRYLQTVWGIGYAFAPNGRLDADRTPQ